MLKFNICAKSINRFSCRNFEFCTNFIYIHNPSFYIYKYEVLIAGVQVHFLLFLFFVLFAFCTNSWLPMAAILFLVAMLFFKLCNGHRVTMNYHAKSGASCLKIKWVMINFVIWWPFYFPKCVICRRSIWTTM